MSRSSRNRPQYQEATGGTGYVANSPTGGNTGGGGGNAGGGGSKFLLNGPINIAIGKKGITLTGPNIETVQAPLQARQVQRQGQPNAPWTKPQGGGDVLTACMQSATQLALIAAQAAQQGNHPMAAAASQQSQILLQALGQMSTTQGGKQGFTLPQVQYAGQQQSRRSKARQKARELVTA